MSHPRSRLFVALAALLAAGGLASAAVPPAGAAGPHGGLDPNGSSAGRSAPADAERARLRDYFTDEDLARARRYRGPRYALGFGSLGAGLLVLGALAGGPWARGLGRWAVRATGDRWWLTALLLVAVVIGIAAAASLPFGIAQHVHDRRFGLTTQTIPGLLGDQVKATGFRLVLQATLLLGFVAIARALPRGWPAAAAAGAAAAAVLVSFVLPVVYEPLFNKFTPVDAGLRGRVLSIAARAGVRVGDVLVADASRRTTRQNAYVSGLGATKRVVLYDTLIAKSSSREVDLVVAHELAHEAHGDVPKDTGLAAAAAAAGVGVLWWLTSWGWLRARTGITGPGDARVVVLVLFLSALAALVTSPLVSAVSRRMEASADRAAIEYTRDPETAVRIEVSLARDNLADLEPNGFIRWAFFTHPPTLERIQIALDARASTAREAVP